jgi:uncharacterized protein (TIGR03086 family)
MDERKIFVIADQAIMDVINHIKPEQWEMSLPEWFSVRQEQRGLKLRAIISYHAYDEAWVPDTLAGKTIAEVGDSHGQYGDDLLGDDPRGTYASLQAQAKRAVEGLEDLDQTVHLTYGDFPAREYLWHITVFRGLRSFELNRLIGADTAMPEELVRGLWQIVEPHAEEWRAIGIFGPKQPEPAGADLQTKLLALTGRLPE